MSVNCEFLVVDGTRVIRSVEKKYRAFAWSINDIKGISPSIYMHKILMEDNVQLSIKHQRRLNPIMKEVVKKEVLKWLNAGLYMQYLTAHG